MNTATRVIAQNRFQASAPVLSFITRPKLFNVILLLMLVLSAFGIIYTKDLNRRLFIEHQTLQSQHDKLYEDWGKLLLEQSTWSTQSRVRKIATSRLNMNLPTAKELVVLRLHR